jgi:hypothetical protein
MSMIGKFLLTGLASVLAMPADAQEQKADADLDLEPVKGTEELWYLLTALDTLIFCLAVAVIKEPAAIVQARREIQPYSSQLSDPKAEEAFDVALKSSDGQARVEQNKNAWTTLSRTGGETTSVNNASISLAALLMAVFVFGAQHPPQWTVWPSAAALTIRKRTKRSL